MSNNSHRLLTILDFFMHYTDKNNPLKEPEIKELLTKQGISIANRKTIYKDIQTLIDFDYDIYYDTYKKGYYLEEAPFSLAEIKILIDSINSINLDNKSKDTLTKKLFNFVSKYQVNLLNKNIINTRNQNVKNQTSYVKKLEIILDAIEKYNILEISYNNKTYKVLPYFIFFSNNKYYLYVTFEDSYNPYSFRIDRLTSIMNLNETFVFKQDIVEKIKKKIKTSYGNLDKNSPEIIQLQCSNYNQLINRLEDDFPDYYLDNKNNIVIEYRPNELFFSKLANYGDQLKIVSPSSVKKAYIKYLENIINSYLPKKGPSSTPK